MKGWASGRRPWLVAALWALAFVLVYLWWWVAGIWPGSPWEDTYGIFMISAAPTLAGAMALFGILPGVDWVDQQAVAHPQRRDTVAAGVIAVTFGAIPPLARWLFDVTTLYLRFVSETRLPPPDARYFWMWGLETSVVLAVTCGMVGLLGRLLGPLMGLACFAALLTIQGYRVAPELIPRVGEQYSLVSYVGALLTITLGLGAFRLSRSGTRPLMR